MDNDERPKSPGLKWRRRRTGPPVPCWFADPQAIAAGYPVKYANLKLFADRPTILVERCQRLQSEMLLWMSGHRDTAKSFDGTFGSLFDFYERDPESSYQDLKHGVKRTYNIYIRRLHPGIGLDAARALMARYADDPARLEDLSERFAAFRLACAFERLKRAGRIEDVSIDDPFDPKAEVSVKLTEARWQSANRESPPRDAPPDRN